MPKLSAFPYYGGKNRLSTWIVPLLPKCEHYVEPFCGAASILLNRERSPIETINDMNSDVVNFFFILRTQGDELIELLKLTPYAREEFYNALHPTCDQLERARRFYVRILQGFGGKLAPCNGWGYNIKTPKSKLIAQWLSCTPKLERVIDRLIGVQLENRPAIDVIQRLDYAGALFYCDPPYVLSTRVDQKSYTNYEMDDNQHIKLAETLKSCIGKVAISGYRSELYDRLYEGWTRLDKETITTAGNTNKTESNQRPKRTESLWINYKLPETNSSLSH